MGLRKYGQQEELDQTGAPAVNSPSWIPQLQPSPGNSGSIMELFENNKVEQAEPSASEMADRNGVLRNAAQSGVQSAQAGGGLGGTLTSVGSTIGIGSLGAAAGTPLAAMGPVGWGVMAGGLVLSAIGKKKQEKAAREQAAIQSEMDRRQRLIALARESANSEFRLV